MREIVDFTGTTTIRAVASVQRLLVKHLLHLHSETVAAGEGDSWTSLKRVRDEGMAMRVSLGSRSDALSQAVDTVIADFESVAFTDFEEAERDEAIAYLVRAMDNIRRVL